MSGTGTPEPTVSGDFTFRSEVDAVLAQLAAERAAPAEAAEPIGPAAGTTITLPVLGMTCRTCENRIARHVGRIPGVEHVAASATRGSVEIRSTHPIPEAALANAIRAAGYEVGRTPWLTADANVWLTAITAIVLVGALAVIVAMTGIADLASGFDLGSGGLIVALLLGLTAGVSTCAALVGGLVLALSAGFDARRTARNEAPAGAAARMRPALAFVTGRIVGYAALGAALGAVGATITMPAQVTAILMVAAAIVMTILGTRLTGLSPKIAAWSPTLPGGLARTLGVREGTGGGYSDGRAGVLGAASFFLPCGFTQAVQVYALSTGSPLLAGAILGIFALGTAPGLLALAGLPVVVPAAWRPTLVRFIGVVVIGFAVVNATAAFRLAGFGAPTAAAAAAAATPASPVANDGTQALVTFQDAAGYSPEVVSIYANTPTTWTIQSSTTATCATALVVPSLNISVRLRKGANTIRLPALPAGMVAYSCSMGMYGGWISVVPRS